MEQRGIRKRGRQVYHSYEGVLLGGAFDKRWPGATDMQNVFEAELVEVNPPVFAEGTFDLQRTRPTPASGR